LRFSDVRSPDENAEIQFATQEDANAAVDVPAAIGADGHFAAAAMRAWRSFRRQSWRIYLTSLSSLAALPNSRRFFVNLLRGVAPFRRDQYRCWSIICGRQDGLMSDFIGGFGDTCAQSQEAKRGCALRLQPRRAAV
jgi:hypothetical protein